MKKVCVIGAEGCIGSMVSQKLLEHQDEFESLFIDKKNLSGKTLVVTDDDLFKIVKVQDVIIYLAGESRANLIPSDYNKNFEEIENLVKNLRSDQLLIYASTSAIYEGLRDAKEDDIIDENKICKLAPYALSMLERERTIKRYNIRSVGLRLASTIGSSLYQSGNRMHLMMLKTALFTGRINVPNNLTMRPFIFLDETVEIILRFINEKISGHHIYNISGFNSSAIAVATAVSKFTGAKIVHPVLLQKTQKKIENNYGFSMSASYQKCHSIFSMNNDKLVNKFPDLKLITDNDVLIEKLWNNKEYLLKQWGNKKRKIKCIICEAEELTELILLNDQPLANGFLKSPNEEEIKYPLGMYRCEKCHHNQLSNIINPEKLFTEYIYVSGTANSNHKYFEWFARKIDNDFSHFLTFSQFSNKRVLEVGCNDGSQLDKFKELGWETYGVDPAKNLALISREKGHTIEVDFWGESDFPNLPNKFDVIIAQNVVAHVPNPIKFVQKFNERMTESSRLYIQTSQAEIFQTGEYDTLYHEHVSYFTIKSMLHLAERCQMTLENIEKVNIHGVSYVFTLRIGHTNSLSPNVLSMLELENNIYSPYNSIFFREQVLEIKRLIEYDINQFKNQGFGLVGFGAAAKGNTLLNSLNTIHYPEYIVDENPLKQGLYSPGTRIPIVNLEYLENDKRPLFILVLAWNFLEEIQDKIYKIRSNKEYPTVLLVPFPHISNILLVNTPNKWEIMSNINFPNISLPLLPYKRKIKTLLTTHFYNEELLLPYWISHHAPMFDDVVLIDHHSTDNSRKIIKELAPSNWKIISTQGEDFDCGRTDDEIRLVENSYDNDVWKICLTTTEFLIWPDMEEFLSSQESLDPLAFKIKFHAIVGDDDIPLEKDLSLIYQRNQIGTIIFNYDRYIHKNCNNIDKFYVLGRHGVNIPQPVQLAPNAMIFKYIYSPWPEILPRKLQITPKRSVKDIYCGAGWQHGWDQKEMENRRSQSRSALQCNFFRNSIKGSDSDLLQSKILYKQFNLPWCSST